MRALMMTRRLKLALVAIVACVLLPEATSAQSAMLSNEALGAQAEQAFRQGVENQTRPLQARRFFGEAADRYLELDERGVRSPSLYLNLGNAAFLADRWPEALWAYQVGLQLDPNDTRLREHRDFVRAKVFYPPSGQGRPESDAWPAWLYRPSPLQLACCTAFFYVLTCVSGMLIVLSKRPMFYLVMSLALVGTLAAGCGFWRSSEDARADRETPLVVLMENTTFQRGNGRNYPPHPELPMLPRGMEARQLHRRGAWLQVRLSTGEVGWVPRNRVLVVLP